jgi:hypothetical protein
MISVPDLGVHELEIRRYYRLNSGDDDRHYYCFRRVDC